MGLLIHAEVKLAPDRATNARIAGDCQPINNS